MNIYDRQSYGVALVEIPYSILAETIYGGNGKSNLQQGAIFIGDEQGNRIYATQSDDPYRDMGCGRDPPAGTAHDAGCLRRTARRSSALRASQRRPAGDMTMCAR